MSCTTKTIMKRFLRLFPSPAATLMLFILPLLFTVYFVITRFSDKFIAEQNITYFDVQHSLMGQFFVTQTWLDWFNRFMDFALWGMFGAIIVIIAWLVSTSRTAVDNHNMQTNFRNFKEHKTAWHQRFLVVATMKIILGISMFVAFFSLLGQGLPLLAMNIASSVQHFTPQSLLPVLYAILFIVLLQFLFITCIKTFKAIRADE